MTNKVVLNRTLSLPMLVLYGLGTTIGAGIYALVGEIASIAGYFSPVSFLVASVLASFTAMSFAELSARFPQAAGAAIYVKEGFSSKHFSTLIGMLVITAGLVSAAALVNGFVGYLHQFISVDRIFAILCVVILLGSIAAWGIAESVAVAAFITVIEVAGLLLLIAVSSDALATFPSRWTELIPSADAVSWGGIYLGAILSFYAFIGFEDMVVVAEEVKDVKRNLPLAILLTLGITTFIYLLLMTSIILSLPPDQIASSEAPLALIYKYHTGEDAVIISVIGMFAIINGALIQIIMAARVMYGLSSRGQMPAFLAKVHQKTRTPLVATMLATAIVLGLALLGRLASLAEATSVIMLMVFSIVNLALWRVKRRDEAPTDIRVFPIWVPITGFFVSSGFVLAKVADFISG